MSVLSSLLCPGIISFNDQEDDLEISSSIPAIRSRTGLTTSASTRTVGATRDESSSFVVAIIEGRGVASEVGMCFIDVKTSECILSQIADSQTYAKTLHKISVYQPYEIVVSNTAVEPSKSKLVKILEENAIATSIVPIGRRLFNNAVGLNYIKQYSIEDEASTLILGLSTKFYCLAATAAALKYIENQQHVFFTNQSLRFRYRGCEGTMMIDSVTARNLELIHNISKTHNNYTLYGVLNHTCTSMGARLLRINILQPLTNVDIINARLDSVEALKLFQDVDHLITALIKVPQKQPAKHAEQNINNIIILKHTIQSITSLRTALASCQSILLTDTRQRLEDERLGAIEKRINYIINEDATYQKSSLGLRNQRCYAVKAGFNGLLDVGENKLTSIESEIDYSIYKLYSDNILARQTYKETTNDVYELVNGYTEQHNIPLKIQFNPSSGFCLSTTVSNLEHRQLPLIFINVTKKRKTLTFTTLELMKMNSKINVSLAEVYTLSDKAIAELISEIRININILYEVSESIAMLDLITSLAHQCTVSNNYCRPEFTEILAIKSGRHPICEHFCIDPFIPNDTYANSTTNFQLITGPNMSGKSTYLRQIALICIMSQIGSFVPAEYASFRIVDQLFTCICNELNIENNTSTFILEMRETAYILQNITDKSLVLIDELGRGTSTHDGLGITYAVCEELLRSNAFIFFATHFHELTTSLAMYANVVNLHLEVQIDGNSNDVAMKYLYKIKDGSTNEEHYEILFDMIFASHIGLKFGQLVGLPEDVIQRASEVSYRLKELIDAGRERSETNKLLQKRKLLLQLAQHLSSIRSSSLDKETLKDYLRRMQEEFIEKMEILIECDI
ncbi:178_t:CDS:10 [Paraglomus occultum]|uniref:DNA mismatch repair protein MSH3 n=1 Tax=Paraglomus occultum TaxID=144539 RepID=A0A9N9EZU6_9GLOM|nr:178_t:CDS:10 [Paraglomus occultum]